MAGRPYRLLHGLAGDRLFLTVILLSNLGYAVLPLVGIVALAILWWLI